MQVLRARRHPGDKIPPLKGDRGFIFNNLFKGSNEVRYYVGHEPGHKIGFIQEARTGKVVLRFESTWRRWIVMRLQYDAPAALKRWAKRKSDLPLYSSRRPATAAKRRAAFKVVTGGGRIAA